ncbi:MAG: hypothetical protein A2092_02550 [Rhodobacteraceae bacterium GWE1_64_9]|nr:hypothetical protein [Gemmobacter sp.]OHC45135.1 MAG: hypothetical protein A2092_02550 [Rhodobacteraceae bacterium GWE1_64_9]HBU16224.1 hypothetical protein [Gemmobacter sp.]
MTKAITKHNLFPPEKPKAASRADVTDASARAIMEAEVTRRDAKTARLRQLRLDQQAADDLLASQQPVVKKPARAKSKPAAS